jgi:hypothetical protein
MATNFQSAVTFVLKNFFSKFILHFACVKNREKLTKKFFHFGSRWRHLPKGLVKNCFSAITSEVLHFFQSAFCIRFVLSARKFNGRKKIKLNVIIYAEVKVNCLKKKIIIKMYTRAPLQHLHFLLATYGI